MRFVVDANVLFALSNSKSAANFLVSKFSLKLIAPDFALLELLKYKNEILKKSDKNSFQEIINSLRSKVLFVDKREYSKLIKKMKKNIPDPKDAAYLALAHLSGLAIWSNDRHFKEQSIVNSFTTKELIELLED